VADNIKIGLEEISYQDLIESSWHRTGSSGGMLRTLQWFFVFPGVLGRFLTETVSFYREEF
jgi:hypothetical protein